MKSELTLVTYITRSLEFGVRFFHDFFAYCFGGKELN